MRRRKSFRVTGLALVLAVGLNRPASADAPPSIAATGNAGDVRAAGAIGDGKAKDTAAFQKALDQCAAAATGGTVLVPPGDYLIGSISLPSHVTLQLDKGARLIGSPDLDDYPITKIRWEGKWIDGHRGLVYAEHAKDVAVVGPGEIVGDPKLGGREMPRRPPLIEPIDCDGVRLEGFSTKHHSMWSIHPTYCENVVAPNLTIRSTGGNGDGIDVDSCRHVRIDRCDIDTGDDCVAIKSGRGMEGYKAARPSEDVSIADCTLGDSIFACIGIGSETSGGIRDVHIEHCTFTHAKTFAVYIKSNTGRGAGIENVTGDDLKITGPVQGFLRLNITGSGIKDPEPVPGDEGIPFTRNFRFSHVTLHGGVAVDAAAIPPEKPLDGLSLVDIAGPCKKGILLANVAHAELRDIALTDFTGPKLSTQNVTGTGLEGAVAYTPTPAKAPKPRNAAAATRPAGAATEPAEDAGH